RPIFCVCCVAVTLNTPLLSASRADPISAGSIKLEGEELRLRDPADEIAKGIVMVPEDRKEQGLIVGHRIRENIIYANLD
ncbi:sugar ABC transporter ATP-binding protein, partial [Rhizobium ruizarguesonis]